MILCVRTVRVPPEARARFLAWIDENRAVRERHGILFELVLERSMRQNPAKAMPPGAPAVQSDDLVLTAWASHEALDAWIDSTERDRLTDSEVHRAVEYGPITRYDVADGYVSLGSLGAQLEHSKEETT